MVAGWKAHPAEERRYEVVGVGAGVLEIALEVVAAAVASDVVWGPASDPDQCSERPFRL